TELRDSFFEKFATAGKKKGTGLGTYIAKLVVNMHQGSIAYHSSEEYGTDIVILLPQ
ncbi:ATP-binding protein, partial [Tunicatimonas sp.]|uniref:ATP-binding protein n=1 Tax=Tunicatimonas sp. TaxID=1940096 RepID=UPI003C71145B